MKRISILGGLAVSLFALPALAQETAYTTNTVTLEAGPAPDYPAVGTFGANTPVTLYGCINGYDWCDVSYGDARGWVDGQALVYPYENQRVPVAVYGPRLSLPIVTFSFDNYWGAHYHDRPFFNDRARFEHHAPPHDGHPGGHPEGHPGGPHPGPAAAHPPGPHPQGPHPQPGHPVAHPQAVAHPGEHPGEAPHPAQPGAHPPAGQAHPQGGGHPAEEHHEGPPGEAPH
jgi:uncharacterized protein YraI